MIEWISCRSALVRSSLPELDYCLNPYVGCGHGCRYCYVPDVLGDETLHREWGKRIRVKENLEQILAKEVRIKKKGVVGVSTATDPYQPLEKDLELTRRCLQLLRRAGFTVSIQTKSPLVLRDRDLFEPSWDIGVTIITLDPELARILEPNAPPPDSRVHILEELADMDTWLFLGPIIPGVNDGIENLTQLVKVAKRTKSVLMYDWFRPKPWAVQRMTDALTEAGYKMSALGDLGWRAKMISTLTSLCRSEGVKMKPAF